MSNGEAGQEKAATFRSYSGGNASGDRSLVEYRVDTRTLGRLLDLYFPGYPALDDDLKRLASELNRAHFRFTDVVECCERVLPLLSTPGSVVEQEFKRFAAEGVPTQSEILRFLVGLHKQHGPG